MSGCVDPSRLLSRLIGVGSKRRFGLGRGLVAKVVSTTALRNSGVKCALQSIFVLLWLARAFNFSKVLGVVFS